MLKRLGQIVYVVVCIGLALYAWMSWSATLPQYRNEVLIAATILLSVCTFPVSVIFGVLFAVLAPVIPIDRFNVGNAFLNWMLVTWVPLSVAGYLQWFVWIPYWVCRWRGYSEVGRENL